MIDEKKIQEAASSKHNPAFGVSGYLAARTAFAAGVEWFKKALWHDVSVKPEGNAVILYQWLDDRDTMDVGIDGVSRMLNGQSSLRITESLSGATSRTC